MNKKEEKQRKMNLTIEILNHLEENECNKKAFMKVFNYQIFHEKIL